jgi:hypothetical protein
MELARVEQPHYVNSLRRQLMRPIFFLFSGEANVKKKKKKEEKKTHTHTRTSLCFGSVSYIFLVIAYENIKLNNTTSNNV